MYLLLCQLTPPSAPLKKTLHTYVTAVVLINVLGFYEPLRILIHSAIKEGFIEPQNERLVLFVDGPSKSQSKSDSPSSNLKKDEEWIQAHEEFDWGTKALQALDGWDGEKEGFRRYPFKWGRRRDESERDFVRRRRLLLHTGNTIRTLTLLFRQLSFHQNLGWHSNSNATLPET